MVTATYLRGTLNYRIGVDRKRIGYSIYFGTSTSLDPVLRGRLYQARGPANLGLYFPGGLPLRFNGGHPLRWPRKTPTMSAGDTFFALLGLQCGCYQSECRRLIQTFRTVYGV